MNQYNKGKIHSFQTLGTLDGPGVRYVVFLQGCNLRCGCCHNPDTWDINGGNLYFASEVIDKVLKYKEYFGNSGGLTVSGGEPLLQASFVKELFMLAKENGISTCLDTSGSILNNDIYELLEYSDYVLLDIKYINNELYLKHVGCSIDNVIKFLDYLETKNIYTIIRQVIIPTINDNVDDIIKLDNFVNKYDCVKKVELLPFRKLCVSKYDALNIEFPFNNLNEASKDTIDELYKYIKKI